MTTRTIREADITIIRNDLGYTILPVEGPRLRGSVFFTNYAAALQARADIIDERAGAAQVGDLVRIGLKGQATYRVDALGSGDYSDTCMIVNTETHARRRIAFDRLHVVEAKR